MRFSYCRLEKPSDGHTKAWALLAALYREERGVPLPRVAHTERGKPYFPDEALHFSLSHTPRHAFCVLHTAPVGIDAEELSRRVPSKLAERVLSDSERAQLSGASDQNRALLTFWVLKEAQAKLTGEGLNGFPNHTHFKLDDPRVRELDGCLVAIVTEEHDAV